MNNRSRSNWSDESVRKNRIREKKFFFQEMFFSLIISTIDVHKPLLTFYFFKNKKQFWKVLINKNDNLWLNSYIFAGNSITR